MGEQIINHRHRCDGAGGGLYAADEFLIELIYRDLVQEFDYVVGE